MSAYMLNVQKNHAEQNQKEDKKSSHPYFHAMNLFIIF